METTPKPTLIALDTNVLIDLAEDLEVVIDCLHVCAKRCKSVAFIVIPAVLQELAFLYHNGSTERLRNSCGKALKSIRDPWRFNPVNCVPVGHGITEQIALKLRQQKLLPEEEVSDSLVVAEAALLDVEILITNDAHLKDIDRQDLKALLSSCHVSVPVIASPAQIVGKFWQ